MDNQKLILNRYTRQSLITLFLIAAFPVHLWAIILILNDIEWVAERTNFWDAIGVGAYGLVYALIESVIIFLIIFILGFLLPKAWSVDKRVALLSVVYLITATWAILGQLYFFIPIHEPQGMIQFLVASGHPLRILYGASLLLVGASILIPTAWIIFDERATQIITNVISRLATLSIFYLVFDLIAVIIIILRNL